MHQENVFVFMDDGIVMSVHTCTCHSGISGEQLLT